jgi:hypothetical protein
MRSRPVTTVSTYIASKFFYVFLGVIALTLFQRRHGSKVHKKRMSVLFIAIFIFVLQIFAVLIIQFKLSDFYLLIYAAAAVTLIVLKKEAIFPFKLKCVNCGEQLTFNEILFDDSNVCEKCVKER